MIDTKELRSLMGFARKILTKDILKKLKKVKDKAEKIEVLKYTLKIRLDLKYDTLKKEVKKMEEKNKDVFFAETKLNLLYSKIKLFEATFHKDDFNNVLKLFKEVEKEAKHV